MAMADMSRSLLYKVSCGRGTPYVFITKVQAQTGHAASSAQKQNALCLLITEL